MALASICVRNARLADAAAISAVHDAAWFEAYSGIIPGGELTKMIARRGPAWWRMTIARRANILVLDFEDTIVGYASYGRNRLPALPYRGELFELYLLPEYQGVGLGKRLFRAVRTDLARYGYDTLVVWALAENERADAFYRRLGGCVVRRALEKFGARSQDRLAYGFS